MKEKSRAIPQAPCLAKKAKRHLAVSQEALGSRTSLHAEQGSNPVSRDVTADASGASRRPANANRAGTRRRILALSCIKSYV